MPGSKTGKPDNDEMEMMKDIMGNDMKSDLEQETPKRKAKVPGKKQKEVRPHDHLNVQ
jgi:hypothetical protein